MFRIERATTAAAVHAAEHLMDGPVLADTALRFLQDPTHHLLLAYDHDGPVGMVSGVELTHPDKGTEMFLYELAVDEGSRRQGVGSALVRALAAFARERDCYDMWVLTERDNTAAVATYRGTGGEEPTDEIMITWTFR